MIKKEKAKAASNVMDSIGYWREYPERDLEHVRRYPCMVERVMEPDVWKRKKMKLFCVLPGPDVFSGSADTYLNLLKKELAIQADMEYIKNLEVESVVFWNQGSTFDAPACRDLYDTVINIFNCTASVSLSILGDDEFCDAELWFYAMDILAAGVGAVGYVKGHEYYNTCNFAQYSVLLEQEHLPVDHAFPVPARILLERSVRKAILQGKLNLDEFFEHHGFLFEKVFEEKLQHLHEQKEIKLEDRVCRFFNPDRQEEIIKVLFRYQEGDNENSQTP